MDDSGIYFDVAGVALDIEFIESLTLTKSTKSGRPEPFRLLPFQKKLVGNLFGWKRSDHSRLYRKCYFSTARKNAKTQAGAAIALLLLIDPTESRPEILIAAKDRDQASFCYQAAADMVEAHDELRAMLDVTPYSREIRNPQNGGILRALSSEGKTKHGSNPSAVIFDELHVWGPGEEELFEALTTGSAARRQPLQIILTTAGAGQYSLCRRQYDYAKKVLDGTTSDPTYLPLIWELPEGADWTDETQWGAANPGLGEISRVDALREACEKAKLVPSDQNTFRRFFLNQWVDASSAWIPVDAWDACAGDFEELREIPAYGGLDLGSTGDLTSFVLVWPVGKKVYARAWFWVPAHGLAEKSKRDGVRYDLWARDGHIATPEGNWTDWRSVVDHISSLAETFTIASIGFDRYGARDTASSLGERGLTVAPVTQGYALSPALKRLEELIMSGNLVHDGNPILRWNLSCTTVTSDGYGNLKIEKLDRIRSTKRIDGVVALTMAISRMMDAPPAPEVSVYSSRGMRSL